MLQPTPYKGGGCNMVHVRQRHARAASRRHGVTSVAWLGGGDENARTSEGADTHVGAADFDGGGTVG